MKAKECVVWCHCEQGVMFKTALKNPVGIPVAFWVTEDEYLYFRGYCSKCGQEFEFKYSIIQLLFDCPSNKGVQ